MKRFQYKLMLVLSLSFLSMTSWGQDMLWEELGERGDDEKAIYGLDDRHDLHEFKEQVWRVRAKSTAAMIARDELIYNSRTKSYSLKGDKDLQSMGICSSERFATQPMAATCTGFLVAPDQIVTAGHCIRDLEGCKKYRWVFDYAMENEREVKKKYTKSEVFQCKKIIKRSYDPALSLDYAVIQLYRKIKTRAPLEIEKEVPRQGTPVVIIGHPSGLPSKIAAGDSFVKSVSQYSFKANVDSFGGNSGSPIFHASSGKVLGILVSGSPDYVFDPEGQCRRTNFCNSGNCFDETASLGKNILD